MSDVTLSPAIEFDHVSIVFGKRPEDTLPLMDKGLSRREIGLATTRDNSVLFGPELA